MKALNAKLHSNKTKLNQLEESHEEGTEEIGKAQVCYADTKFSIAEAERDWKIAVAA